MKFFEKLFRKESEPIKYHVCVEARDDDFNYFYRQYDFTTESAMKDWVGELIGYINLETLRVMDENYNSIYSWKRNYKGFSKRPPKPDFLKF